MYAGYNERGLVVPVLRARFKRDPGVAWSGPDLFWQEYCMSKREMIDEIRRHNPTAKQDFLAAFQEDDLAAYLRQLFDLERDRRRPAQMPLPLAG